MSGVLKMSNQKAEILAKKALESVAKKNGVSVEEVRREIEIVIAAAKANSDPEIQAFWISIPHKGEIPTPEEVNLHLVEMELGNTHH